MELRIILLFVFIAAIFAELHEEKNFLDTSDECVTRENVSSEIKLKLDRFEYPNIPIVHKFLHCVWLELGFWNDRTGFNVERIANEHKYRANAEVLIPILSNCNQNSRHEPPLKWCYTAFKCIFDSRVGQWFREDVTEQMREREIHSIHN